MKKRFFALFLTLVMVLTLLPTAAFAADDGGFTIEDGILTAYNGPGGDVVIPEGVTGFSGPRRPDDDEVSEYFADSPWEAPIWGTGLCGVFEGNQTITSVTLPDSVTEIDDYTFAKCANLRTVRFGSGLKTIGRNAFFSCENLTQIEFSTGLTHISFDAFAGCTGLTRVDLPSGLTSIGDCAFCRCTGLVELNIPSSIKSIGYRAFSNCTNLERITIANPSPDIVFGYDTLAGCNKLGDGPYLDLYTIVDEDGQDTVQIIEQWRQEIIENNRRNQRYQIWLKSNRELLNSGIDESDYVNTIVTADVQVKSDEICKGLKSNAEKVRAIHRWVTKNIYYNFPLLAEDYPMPTAQDVLDQKTHVCCGYAILTQALCWAQKIPCVYVTGETTEGYHAWNAVRVNGEWSWMDTTWDTFNGYFGGNEWKPGNTRLDYFCCSSDFLAVDHQALYVQTINGINANLPSQTAAETEQLLKREQMLEEGKYDLLKLAEDAKKDSTLSDWAKEETVIAIMEGLVPEEIMGQYGNAITREEFCTLMVTLLEQQSGKTIAEYANSKGAKYNQPFTDTNSTNVGYANALGIVYGVSNTEFAPDKTITRQEAATMLARTGKVLGLNAKTGLDFADKDRFADWASDSISYVSSLSDPTNSNRVMAGTGNGNFSPLGTYSRQQAILTSVRMFHCAA